QDQVALAFRGAWVRQTNVRIQSGDLAFRVLRVIRDVGFGLAVHRRTRGFAAAEDRFLFLQRGTVPALDEVADDAHGLIAAVGGPGRFVAARLHPDQLVHGLLVVRIGVGR
nr:hypothetical protein [Tanacetum cinerariifolium]